MLSSMVIHRSQVGCLPGNTLPGALTSDSSQFVCHRIECAQRV